MRKHRKVLFPLMILALLTSGFQVLAASQNFPNILDLPKAFRPEGIVSGTGTDFYAGSLADGSIYKGDLRTGEGGILAAGPGASAVGLSFDHRTGYLYVAGGPSGQARVYDTQNGELVELYQLTMGATFINDVVVTQSAAYFTDSVNPVLYRIPLSPTGGLPDDPNAVQPFALSGDYMQASGFNANGIDATPEGDALIIVQSNLGALYRVDPLSGEADRIDLGGDNVSFGDGILLDGFTLYVVRNRLNEIAVVQLNPDLSAGEIVRTIANGALDVPTTLAEFGSRLYAVNARFNTPVTPDTEYWIVQVGK